MKALVLCGGVGRRLMPFSGWFGKPMVPLLNVPMVVHTIKRLVEHGITDIALNHYSHRLELLDLLGDGAALGARITYLEERFQYGTGGALHLAAQEGFWGEEYLLVTVADMVSTLDLSDFAQTARAHRWDAAVACIEHTDPEMWEGDVCVVDPASDVVTDYGRGLPMSAGGLAASGTWIFSSTCRPLIPVPSSEFVQADNVDLNRDVLPLLIDSTTHDLHAYVGRFTFEDLGTPSRLVETSIDALDGRFGTFAAAGPNAPGSPPGCLVDPSAVIASSARLSGNCVVGPDVIIEEDCELIDCVVMAGTTVRAGTVVGGGVLADATSTPLALARRHCPS